MAFKKTLKEYCLDASLLWCFSEIVSHTNFDGQKYCYSQRVPQRENEQKRGGRKHNKSHNAAGLKKVTTKSNNVVNVLKTKPRKPMHYVKRQETQFALMSKPGSYCWHGFIHDMKIVIWYLVFGACAKVQCRFWQRKNNEKL